MTYGESALQGYADVSTADELGVDARRDLGPYNALVFFVWVSARRARGSRQTPV